MRRRTRPLLAGYERYRELAGDGEQTRSFCYVDDLIDGCVRMMGTDADTTGPVNIGNEGE